MPGWPIPLPSVHVHLLRTEVIPAGTFGRLTVGALDLTTCEDDWKDNQPGESCIPAGVYRLVRTIYRKHGYETFEVAGVPNRSRILVHPGNTEEDTQGCILVGLRRGQIRVPVDEDTGERRVLKEGVVSSQQAFHAFMKTLAGVDEAPFTVEWTEGLP